MPLTGLSPGTYDLFVYAFDTHNQSPVPPPVVRHHPVRHVQLAYNGRYMPLFEYICRECQHPFEALVTSSRQAACPRCASQSLEKQLSVFAVAVSGASTRDQFPAPCGSCGDPRGPGSCQLN